MLPVLLKSGDIKSYSRLLLSCHQNAILSMSQVPLGLELIILKELSFYIVVVLILLYSDLIGIDRTLTVNLLNGSFLLYKFNLLDTVL